MIPLRLAELERLLGCPVSGHDPVIGSIVSDSRKVSDGALFAALPGERVDGHDFAPAAVKSGAAALLVSRRLQADVPQLVVGDVLVALGRIARLVRDRLDPAVVGITGSNGKTTVKEMVASILRLEGPVLATEGNYNNELGLPLTLFRLKSEHRFAVLEMGAGKTGDIAYLTEIAKPDVGLVNNIAPAHLEGFGSLEGVARTKGAMFASLPKDGWAVMNADEPWMDLWREQCTADNVLTFGTSASLPIRIVVALVMGVGGVFVWVNNKAKKRLALIEEQLPDGVELMVRSLRVGHPFSSALQIVARESFIVNPDGVIVKHYEDVDPDTHTDEVLAELERLIAGAG